MRVWFLESEKCLGVTVQDESGNSWADEGLEPVACVDISRPYGKHTTEFLP